ncbi:D-alanyl-D-alanine carboxypeptidase/D-alanyl-D-alanine endopeptidase [Mesoterricola sediminis]|nr:D-alanyl-D-alanine carboxypeptidase/D-alanyl-D-alanine-endopeptidase [Mesoterricola sediminis]
MRMLILCLAAVAGFAQGPALPERLRDLAASPRFARVHLGVHVRDLDTGRTVFAWNADKGFVPGSCAKLFTCASALCGLGPEATFRTSVAAAGPLGADGTLAGDLLLVGRGDPMLLARRNDGPWRPDPLEALADQLVRAGLRRVRGDVVGDGRWFRTRPWGSGWEIQDRAFAYGADVSALTVHDNMVDLRIYPGPAPGRPCFLFPQPGLGLLPLANRTATGPGPAIDLAWEGDTLVVTGALPPGAPPLTLAVPVRNPEAFAARLLRRSLERRGVQVDGTARAVRDSDPTPGRELAGLDSRPLKDLVRATLKASNNLYAQLLLLQQGRSEAAGLAAERTFLEAAGIREGVILEEGSGLSRKNLVAPEALTALLATLDKRPEGPAFRAALPLAGVDGTLQARMGGSAAVGRVAAKTGTLRFTHGLAGYAEGPGGTRLAFALLLNGDPAPDAREVLDRFVLLMAETAP